MKTIAVIFILGWLMVSVSSGESSLPVWGKVSPEELASTSIPEDPNADAVILFDRGEYIFDYVYPLTFNEHKRVKIFTKRGAETANISIHYRHGDKIKGLEGCTITRDGRKFELDPKQVFTKKGEHWDEVVFTLPGIEEGCVYEYRYEKWSKNPYVLDPWFFQNEIFTKSSQVTLNLKVGRVYSFFFRNPGLAKTEPEVQPISWGRQYIWTFENLPPLRAEPYVVCMNDYRMAVYFEASGYENIYYGDRYALDSWGKWGQLADGLYNSLACDKTKFGQRVKELTQNIATDSGKIANIYAYVRQRIKWNGERGIWNLDEKFLDKIMTDQEGTGTEKNLLLLRLLKTAGFDACPVLISTRENGRVIRDKPGLIQFNQVVVRVRKGEQVSFLDAVDRLYPFGMLPLDDLEGYGLVLEGDKSYLIYISGDKVCSVKYISNRGEFSSDGGLACTTLVNYQGYYGPLARKQISEKGKEEFIQQRVKDLAPTTMVDSIGHTSLDSVNQPLEMSIFFSADQYGQPAGGDFYVNPTLFTRFGSNPFEKESRNYPVEFPYPFTEIEDTEFRIPQGYILKTLPANVDREIPGIKFSKTFSAEEDRFLCRRQMVVTQLVFPVSRYQELRNFYQDMVSADQLMVVLAKESK